MLDVIIGAVVYSNFLALLSIGLCLTILTSRVSNFAHGDLAMVGVYTAYTLSAALGLSPYLCLPAAFAVGGFVALLSFALVFEPLRRAGAGPVTLMVASLALDMVIRYSLHIYADLLQRTFNVYGRDFMFNDARLLVGGVSIPGALIGSSLTASVLLVMLYLLLYRTKLGVAMRATIENQQLAMVLGINVRRVFAISWFISGALAATAGVFLPFRLLVNPDTGWSMLLSMFASVIVGGVGSLLGSVLGAYLIGFSELLFSYLLASLGISTAYRPLVVFAAIVATLMLSPRGLSILWSNGVKGSWRS
ncbi:MAG: branched-chain amino acid ABC transporter permease [Thermofilaceae archaeon]